RRRGERSGPWRLNADSHIVRPAQNCNAATGEAASAVYSCHSWRYRMAKYLIEASYTADGAKGLLKDGGTKRRQAAEQAIKSAGGKLEGFYFAFGENDAFVIVEAPDHATVAAVSLAI